MRKLIVSLLIVSSLAIPLFVKAEDLQIQYLNLLRELIVLLTQRVLLLQTQLSQLQASQATSTDPIDTTSSSTVIQPTDLGVPIPPLFVAPSIPLQLTQSRSVYDKDWWILNANNRYNAGDAPIVDSTPVSYSGSLLCYSTFIKTGLPGNNTRKDCPNPISFSLTMQTRESLNYCVNYAARTIPVVRNVSSLTLAIWYDILPKISTVSVTPGVISKTDWPIGQYVDLSYSVSPTLKDIFNSINSSDYNVSNDPNGSIFFDDSSGFKNMILDCMINQKKIN